MITVWEKRPGRWKVSGDSKVYPSKEAATKAAADHFEIVTTQEAVVENDWLDDYEEQLMAEEEIDPLEALRQARIERDGSIEEGSDHEPDHEEQGFSEGTD
jgi:hypothetical protein